MGPKGGRWRGWYVYAVPGPRHSMELALEVRGALHSGGGMDDVGTFTIHGSYDAAARICFWTKRYATHSVYYKGTFDGGFIRGVWKMPGDAGSFCLWPDASGSASARTREKAAPHK